MLEYNDIFYSNSNNISGKVHIITIVSVCVTMSSGWIHVRTLQALCVSVIIVDRNCCLLKLITLAIKNGNIFGKLTLQ